MAFSARHLEALMISQIRLFLIKLIHGRLSQRRLSLMWLSPRTFVPKEVPSNEVIHPRSDCLIRMCETIDRCYDM